MNSQFLDSLSDFWDDLHDINVLWQIGTIAICIALAWGLARLLRRSIVTEHVQQRMVRLGVESMFRVMWPLIALLLVAIAKAVLARWHHVNLLRLAIPLIGSFALIRFAFYVMRRVFARRGPAGALLQTFEKIIALLVWGGVALYLTGLWPELIEFLGELVIPFGSNKVSVLAVLQALISVAITLMLALWAGAALEDRLMRVDSLHSSMRVVLGRMGRAILVLVAVLASLSLVGIDLTVLSVFGGALGVGLGLGLQKIVSSYVSGFVILLERSLAIGDMVNVDKYSGVVTQINTRYTIVRGLDGVETVVPNEILLSNPVQNQSLTDRVVYVGTRVTVDYETDFDSLFDILVAEVSKVDRVLPDPPAQVLMKQFGADGIELEIGFWIGDPQNGKGSVLSNVNRVVWRTFQKNNVKVPFPQREIRLISNVESPEKGLTR